MFDCIKKAAPENIDAAFNYFFVMI